MSDLHARSVAAVLSILLSATPAAAQVVNGSFEDPADHLDGWTLGPGAGVEALQAGNFGPTPIAPPDGDWFALITSGPADIGAADGDFDANGTADFDGSTLATTFTTLVADESLSFRWSFLTDEIGPGGQGSPNYDDLFEVTIDGISILRGSVRKPGGVSPYADSVAYDSLLYTVSSSGPTNGAEFGSSPGGGRTPFQQVCISIADPGTYTLEFLVADQADTDFDSGILLDALQVASACDPRIQLTESDESVVEAKGGGLVFSSVSNGRVAVSYDGVSLTFRSNGDYTGDNPNLQEQIWLAVKNGAVFDISRVTAAVNAEFGDPAISADGRWLAFASSGDLAPPGNADGNFEIYRYDRTAGTILQLTSTSGCDNGQPKIADGGDRVAFVSDCDLGFGSTGSEIVLWDGTFRGVDTLGCVSRDPFLSRADGRYVSFLTDCDGQYPATSNPDGSLEVLQWDTETDVYLEITDVAPGTLLEGLASSADGSFVSFASNADLDPGENPTGDFVVFRYDRTTASFLQLVDPDPLALFSITSLDDSGAFVVAERIDLLTGAFDVVLFDASLPGTAFPVAQGSATVSNNFPVVAVANNRPLVVYQSNADLSGTNQDANVEIWAAGAAFDPPQAAVYCSAPNLPIPDNTPAGVNDVITVGSAGLLADLDVYVRIEHTWVGDLRVRLRHLDTGTTAHIIRRPGRPPGSGCSGDDIDATLDDEAASAVEDECVTPGPIAIEGIFGPNQPLGRFDGEDVSGDWQLRVSDRAGFGIGTLLEWCLIPSVP